MGFAIQHQDITISTKANQNKQPIPTTRVELYVQYDLLCYLSAIWRQPFLSFSKMFHLSRGFFSSVVVVVAVVVVSLSTPKPSSSAESWTIHSGPFEANSILCLRLNRQQHHNISCVKYKGWFTFILYNYGLKNYLFLKLFRLTLTKK